MNVLMVAPTPFFADRGCHVRILEEIRSLRARGHHVELVTYPLGSDPEGVTIHRTARIPRYRKLSAGPTWFKPVIDLLLAVRVLLVARKLRPDLIHAHLHEGIAVAAPAAKLLRLPLVGDIQGSLTDELWSHGFPQRPAILRRFLLLIERVLLRIPDLLVTSSLEMAAELREQFGARDVRIAPDGVDTQRFSPDVEPVDLNLPSGVPVVVFLGLLTPYQGIDHLLKAATLVLKKVDSAHFLIMGYPNEDAYLSMARELGIESDVTFTGRVPYELAPGYLACGDIAISAKVSRTESNGKLLNYMAMSLPIVAFETPINREIMGSDAVYAPFDDVPGLARAIIGLLEDREIWAGMGNASRRRAIDRFSWDRTAQDLQTAYEDTIEA